MENRPYLKKERKPEVPFMCNKTDVDTILSYHLDGGKYTTAGYDVIKEHLDTLPDTFEYNSFVQKCQDMTYYPKLIRSDKRAFYESFKKRMYKYKKGKDWKLI